jgi:hypothetical protein
MSISAALNMSLAVTETLTTSDDPLIDSTDAAIKVKLAKTATLTVGSVPDAEMHANMSVPLVAGAATIDFTALTKRGGVAVSFSGKKVRMVYFKNPSTNANPITIVEGAANGLALLGAAFKLVLEPGQEHCTYLGDSSPTIAAGDRTVDITGTLTQALQMIAVAG